MGTEFERVREAWMRLQDAVRDAAQAAGCWEPWWDVATGHREAIRLMQLRHRLGDDDAATYARLHWRYAEFGGPQRLAMHASDAAQFSRAAGDLRAALRALAPPATLPESRWGDANDRARMEFVTGRERRGGEVQ